MWNKNNGFACIHTCTHTSIEFCTTMPLTQPYISKEEKGRDHDRSSKSVIVAQQPHVTPTSVKRAEPETNY